MVNVKICGQTSESDIESAIRFGADRIGMILMPGSPRTISTDHAQTLLSLIHNLGAQSWIVASWTRAEGPCVAGLDQLVEMPELGALQLHGGETPDDATYLRALYPDLQLIKAVGVSAAEDLEALDAYVDVDGFLLDAKPPPRAKRQGGGFGHTFDWALLTGFDPGKPWVLAGGLKPENVAEAIRVTGAKAVDVASGVEVSPGVKDAAKMRAFIESAKAEN